jgi:hypothetical protein
MRRKKRFTFQEMRVLLAEGKLNASIAACWNCRYFSFAGTWDGKEYKEGICLRYPPVLSADSELAGFPPICEYGWCGEYSRVADR